MKKIMLSAILCLGLFGPVPALPVQALAAPPADLAAMRQAGLSQETISRFLAQNLEGGRLAPPMEAALLSRLGQYGGDELAASYLELDRRAARLAERDLSPEIVRRLLDSDIGAPGLKKVLEAEAARLASPASSPPPSPASLPAAPPAPRSATEPSSPARSQEAAAAPEPQPAAPAYQDLRPGQAADPASKLPPPPRPYDVRRQRTDGPWVGATERELADGGQVEVSLSGDPRLVGQEVISSPGGHKIYRYFSGRPDAPESGPDPRQEQKNREDLEIIYQRRD
ncbi:MAG: hypothetical protein LBS31_06625 [Candidatus Adiutrix sp.]|jgi:hypothetical protein|nr:hypothetical protein [Candidatus Adiutrix sp.]